jgi:DNA-binding PadR family transcriptional regulator
VGRNRTAVLEFAVLGLLHRTPMHGYELSKQLNMLLGTFRALSYGTLYPCRGVRPAGPRSSTG